MIEKIIGLLQLVTGIFLVFFVAGRLLLHILALLIGLFFLFQGLKRFSSSSISSSAWSVKFWISRFLR